MKGIVRRMLRESISEKLAAARADTNIDPTEGQKKANNYKHGVIRIKGFEIKIENPKGSYRKGKNRNGKEWKTLMHNDYGYFTRTLGKDGDAIDVFIGPNLDSDRIFAIDQKIGGSFDETKVMLCFNGEEQAKNAYLSNYEDDWKGFWKITETDLPTFKKWLYDGYRQRKPFFDYVEIRKKKLNESFSEKDIPATAKELSDIIERHRHGKTSKLEFGDLNKDEDGTWILKVDGGLNGWGEWDEYLEDILDLFKALSEKYLVWVTDMDVDCLDDTFRLSIGIDDEEAKKKYQKDKKESLSGSSKEKN